MRHWGWVESARIFGIAMGYICMGCNLYGYLVVKAIKHFFVGDIIKCYDLCFILCAILLIWQQIGWIYSENYAKIYETHLR